MSDTTQPRQFRVADGHWKAYDLVCKQEGTSRAEDLVAHIRRRIQDSGNAEALKLLAQADAEVAERRARMHPGRPPKQRAEQADS